jgi:epoxyqueuosine reductase
MISKNDVVKRAKELDFEDIGFTSAEPFDSHREFLLSRNEEYGWLKEAGLDLISGTDPKSAMSGAKSIIVLMETYFREAFPPSMEGKFGRCYMDDDRVTKDGLVPRVRAFRNYLRENGIDSKVPPNLPQRVAAARAGMGTLGKNCLLYSNRVARRGSWILPIAIVVNREFSPDEPTMEIGCPDWCRNACIAACPTGALKGNAKMDPRICISYLTYFGQGITPLEMREPMGMFVYGCDRCQNVCPRNAPWLAQELEVNERAAAKEKYFDLSRLLHMDMTYYETRIWPHMFYMTLGGIWRWKMNVARVMGNSCDERYVPDLIRVFQEFNDERVKGMAAWALGKIGGSRSKKALEKFLALNSGTVKDEIVRALSAFTS